jgi:hypothetical protein
VKVRNRGNASSDGTEQLRVYWAFASSGLPWPDPLVLPWNAIGSPLPLPVIAPGQDYVVQLPWVPPDPTDLSLAAQPEHVCLVARIEPVGVWHGPLLWLNVALNNNIVWKNVTVISSGRGGGRLIVRNTLDHAAELTLRFAVPARESTDHFLLHGDIFVDLGDAVMKKWRRGGQRALGFKVEGKTTRIKVTDPTNAVLGGLLFRAGEEQIIEVRMQLKARDKAPAGTTYNWDVIQLAPLTKNAKPSAIGGERYAFIVPKGGGSGNK